MITVTVQYVNGERRAGSPSNWRVWPGEGVDWVMVADATGTVRIASGSLYWLYLEAPARWVAGSASVGYDPNPVTEIAFEHDTQTERKVPYLPDLLHRDVKLGHWWPGTSAPV